MAYDALDPKKTGLVFFDMLNVYFRGSSEENQHRMEPIVANCVKVREVASALGVPSFYPKADHRADGMDSALIYSDTNYALEPWPDPEQGFTAAFRNVHHGSWTSEVIDELAPTPDDYLIAKHRWSSFHQTHLQLSLRTRGIDTIVLFGGAIHIGVASTAYSARDLDFNIVVVSDACSGPDDNLQMFMERIFPIFTRVRTADEVVEMFKRGAAG